MAAALSSLSHGFTANFTLQSSPFSSAQTIAQSSALPITTAFLPSTLSQTQLGFSAQFNLPNKFTMALCHHKPVPPFFSVFQFHDLQTETIFINYQILLQIS
jgi:hypothetical protein